MSTKKNVFTLSKILDKIKSLALDLDSTKQEVELLNSKLKETVIITGTLPKTSGFGSTNPYPSGFDFNNCYIKSFEVNRDGWRSGSGLWSTDERLVAQLISDGIRVYYSSSTTGGLWGCPFRIVLCKI